MWFQSLGKVTSANQGDKISIDWGDGTPALPC